MIESVPIFCTLSNKQATCDWGEAHGRRTANDCSWSFHLYRMCIILNLLSVMLLDNLCSSLDAEKLTILQMQSFYQFSWFRFVRTAGRVYSDH